MAIDTYQSMIILKVNGLNVPIKKHRVADWIKKKRRAYNMLPKRESLEGTGDTQIESEGMEKGIPC